MRLEAAIEAIGNAHPGFVVRQTRDEYERELAAKPIQPVGGRGRPRLFRTLGQYSAKRRRAIRRLQKRLGREPLKKELMAELGLSSASFFRYEAEWSTHTRTHTGG
jgi:hypothetical protein